MAGWVPTGTASAGVAEGEVRGGAGLARHVPQGHAGLARLSLPAEQAQGHLAQAPRTGADPGLAEAWSSLQPPRPATASLTMSCGPRCIRDSSGTCVCTLRSCVPSLSSPCPPGRCPPLPESPPHHGTHRCSSGSWVAESRPAGVSLEEGERPSGTEGGLGGGSAGDPLGEGGRKQERGPPIPQPLPPGRRHSRAEDRRRPLARGRALPWGQAVQSLHGAQHHQGRRETPELRERWELAQTDTDRARR